DREAATRLTTARALPVGSREPRAYPPVGGFAYAVLGDRLRPIDVQDFDQVLVLEPVVVAQVEEVQVVVVHVRKQELVPTPHVMSARYRVPPANVKVVDAPVVEEPVSSSGACRELCVKKPPQAVPSLRSALDFVDHDSDLIRDRRIAWA